MAKPVVPSDGAQQGPFRYAYARPALTVDCAVFTMARESLRLLLIRRASAPFAGHWALPGGFVDPEEPLAAAARRELAEETGVSDIVLWPVGGYGDPGRDPRGWTVSVVYYALLPAERARARAGDDASAARFHAVNRLPTLAFDHRQIIADCLARLRREIYVLPVLRPLFAAMPVSSTALEDVYRQVDSKAPSGTTLAERLCTAGVIERAGRGYRFVEPPVFAASSPGSTSGAPAALRKGELGRPR